MSKPKLNIKEETSAKKTRSPPKKAKVEQSVPRKKKLKTDADKAAEKAQHLRFGKAELTPDELSRLSKAQKREMYAAHAARSAVHREVDQYEDDNVGTQALSEGEKAAGDVRDISKSRYARKLKKKAKMQGKKGTKTAKGEQNVLKLIIARTLMAVSKPFRYLETLLTTECAGEEFTAKGKEILEEGWKAVERKVLADILDRKQELTALPNAAENECGILNAELKEGQTTPPKHFTEDLLLHAMETASANSMPEGVERQGIGTPATRAATIEKLVQKGFLERKGTKKTKVLLPTDKGKALITVMPEEIQSPEMTADWETKLLQIERGEMEPGEFMTEINTMITELVKNTEMKKEVGVLMKNKIIGVCPNCGKPVVEREKGWFCENRECRFVLWKDNAFFKRLGKRLDAHVADKLLRDGRVRLKDCKSAKGKTYNATVLLSCEADGRSKFSLEFEGGC